jgi:hypothetical protein
MKTELKKDFPESEEIKSVIEVTPLVKIATNFSGGYYFEYESLLENKIAHLAEVWMQQWLSTNQNYGTSICEPFNPQNTFFEYF